jgi:hypothetical protein
VWYQGTVRVNAAGLLAALLALGVAAGGAAANQPSTTYVDKPAGYAITIPKTWQLIPRTAPAVKALAAKLKRKAATKSLGGYYAGIIGNKSGLAGLDAYRFQAFAWPDSKKLYELAFGIEGSELSAATLFASIAQRFKLL